MRYVSVLTIFVSHLLFASSYTEESLFFDEEEEVDLFCDLRVNNVSWFKDGYSVIETEHVYIMNLGRTLYFPAFNEHNIGLYKCIAENGTLINVFKVDFVKHIPNVSTISHTTTTLTPTYTVETLPVTTVFHKIVVNDGEKVDLFCPKQFNKTFVLWMKNGEPLVTNGKAYQWESYNIYQVTPDNVGVFVCRVTTPLGIYEETFDVIVRTSVLTSPFVFSEIPSSHEPTTTIPTTTTTIPTTTTTIPTTTTTIPTTTTTIPTTTTTTTIPTTTTTTNIPTTTTTNIPTTTTTTTIPTTTSTTTIPTTTTTTTTISTTTTPSTTTPTTTVATTTIPSTASTSTIPSTTTTTTTPSTTTPTTTVPTTTTTLKSNVIILETFIQNNPYTTFIVVVAVLISLLCVYTIGK